MPLSSNSPVSIHEARNAHDRKRRALKNDNQMLMFLNHISEKNQVRKDSSTVFIDTMKAMQNSMADNQKTNSSIVDTMKAMQETMSSNQQVNIAIIETLKTMQENMSNNQKIDALQNIVGDMSKTLQTVVESISILMTKS